LPTLVCKRFAKGPFCSDPRLETTDAEQEDCITRARISCHASLMTCLGAKFRQVACHDDEAGENRLPECVDFYSCMDDACREALSKCFCTGLSGLTCTVCPDERPDIEPPPVVEPNNPVIKIKDASLTVSSFDIPIPIVFGKVVVGGNVIWVGNSRREQRTITQTVGNTTEYTVQTYGFVDIAIGLCVGEVEAISRIWIADTLIADNRIEFADEEHSVFHGQYYDLGLNTEFHKGTEAEKMFINTATAEGFGRTPAHRGLSVLMLRNFPVFVAGSQFPTIRVEVISAIDRSVAAFETTGDEDIADTLMAVDPVSNRALVGSGDNIKVVALDTPVVVNEIAADDPIDFDSVYHTPEGNIVFRAGTVTRFVYGYNHEDFLDLDGAPDGPMVSFVAHEYDTLKPVSAVFIASGRDFSYLKTDFEDRTFELLETHEDVLLNPGATYVQMNSADYNSPGKPFVNRFILAFAQDGDNVVINRLQVDCRFDFRGFDPTRLPTKETFYGSFLGTTGSSLTFIDAFEDTYNRSMIMQLEDADGDHHITQYTVDPNDFGWLTRLPEPIENFGSKLKFRQGRTREYLYIVPSGNVYRLSLDDGIVSLVSNLDDYNAPAITGAQYFDPIKGFIAYISNGSLVRLYPQRYAGADATVADVILRTCVEVGIDPAFVDVDAVAGITMDGFLINEGTGIAVIDSVMKFFHISGADNGGKLTFKPLSNASVVSLDADDMTQGQEVRVALDVDSLTTVTVKYYDAEREGAVFSQMVTRDFMEDFNDFVSNEKALEYSANVFTTADVARLSAERTLLRELQRQDQLTFKAAMRSILIEPSDFVNGYRVNTVVIDSTLVTEVKGKTDEDDIYDFTPALDGVSLPTTDNSQVDFDAPVANMLVGFALPPLRDLPIFDEIIYVGQSQPDTSPAYVPSPIFTRGPSGVFRQAPTPTNEAYLGVLVSVPDAGNRAFTTFEDSMVVRFIDTLPGGALNNLTSNVPLYESYTTNVLFIGREVIQYRTSSVAIDGKTVTFTGLLRGRFGTDEFVDSHAPGEVCAIYDPTRIVEGTVNWDAADFGTAVASTYNVLEPQRNRTLEIDFESQLNRKWSNNSVRMFRKDTGSNRGLYFRLFPRMRFVNTFQDDGDANAEVFTNNGRMCLAILSGAYDDDLFREEILKTSEFPINFEQTDIHTNAYIRHLFTDVAQQASLINGFQYRETEMFEDGFDYDDDMYVAVFNMTNPTIEGAVDAFVFEAKYPYVTFEGGLHG
jgi:hypothetical protein